LERQEGRNGEWFSDTDTIQFFPYVHQMAMWHETGHRAEVTAILRSPQKSVFAVGYADGSIRLWNASTESVIATFNGHKKAVTALAFDTQGARLASGSQDTDIIMWDLVAEAGLYR
jgi:U3 small nucleolar RNA-associated protein 12